MKERYNGLDYLRAVSCIGVMAMHLSFNSADVPTGFLYDRVIQRGMDFVFLFMAVSAFGLCCGYYDKVIAGTVDWQDFYRRRYRKILPFFAVLVLIDLLMNFSLSSVCEAVTELTLLHGFVPQELSVIGVGWFLGLIFIFYLIFPFFCVCIANRKRAWAAFAISVLLHLICERYFALDMRNFLNGLCYFFLGGLVYLYRDGLRCMDSRIVLAAVLISVPCYFGFGSNVATRLLVTGSLLALAVSVDCKRFAPVAFLSGISMEFYLSHMVVFRALEKLRLTTVLGGGAGQYWLSFALVFCGTVAFSTLLKRLLSTIIR